MFKNTYFEEHLRLAVSKNSTVALVCNKMRLLKNMVSSTFFSLYLRQNIISIDIIRIGFVILIITDIKKFLLRLGVIFVGTITNYPIQKQIFRSVITPRKKFSVKDFLTKCRDLKVDGCQSNLYVMLK